MRIGSSKYQRQLPREPRKFSQSPLKMLFAKKHHMLVTESVSFAISETSLDSKQNRLTDRVDCNDAKSSKKLWNSAEPNISDPQQLRCYQKRKESVKQYQHVSTAMKQLWNKVVQLHSHYLFKKIRFFLKFKCVLSFFKTCILLARTKADVCISAWELNGRSLKHCTKNNAIKKQIRKKRIVRKQAIWAAKKLWIKRRKVLPSPALVHLRYTETMKSVFGADNYWSL